MPEQASMTSPSVPAFHTSTEVALRLNRLQEHLEQMEQTIRDLAAQVERMQSHTHLTDAGNEITGGPR